jgi:trimeric autotransporter adhesin
MGCITIDSVLVPSQNNMQLNITGPVDICVADSTNVLVSVLGGTPPLTYLWSNGLDSPLASVQPGITYVEITDSVGCVSIDSVRIHQKPRIDFSTDTTKHCRPLANIFLNHTEPASVSVVWEFGDGTSSEQLDSVLHLYPITGYYDVTLTSKTEHCSDSLTKVAYVSVKENAHADFTVQSSSSKENSTLFLFTNQSTNASSYLWSFGDNSFDSIPTVAHLYPFEAGQYLVSLFANNAYNCSDSSTYTILILEKLLYYIPNAFTPDGNNLNDLFKPNFTAGFSPSHFSMSIYNRWGELIYESTDPDQGWDGTDHGRKVQGGIYVWDVQVKEKLSDKIHQYLGHVNLLR